MDFIKKSHTFENHLIRGDLQKYVRSRPYLNLNKILTFVNEFCQTKNLMF